MDWMFVGCAIIGMAVWVASYVSPHMAGLRNGLGTGEFANRMLLLLIPGLTLLCVGAAIGQAAVSGRDPGVRAFTLPVAAVVLLAGFGISFWAFWPARVPQFLRPKWLLAEDLLGDSQAIERIARAKQARPVMRAQLVPVTTGGVSAALPGDWEVNLTHPQGTQDGKGRSLQTYFTANSTVDARADAKRVRVSLHSFGPLTIPAQVDAAVERLCCPRGAQIESIQAAKAGGRQSVLTRFTSAKGNKHVDRWVFTNDDYCWSFSVQASTPGELDSNREIAARILDTITLP